MSRLILFSGGVESTALLTQSKPDDLLLTIEPTYPNDRPSFDPVKADQLASYYGLKVHYCKVNIPIEPKPFRFVHQMRIFVSLANLWVAKSSEITEVWCGRNSKEPSEGITPFINQMMAAWNVLQPRVPFLHPLDHLSKRAQWEMIPADLKPLVSSCMYHRMCGTCRKCMELVCLSENLPRVISADNTQSFLP